MQFSDLVLSASHHSITLWYLNNVAYQYAGHYFSDLSFSFLPEEYAIN